MSWVTLIGRDEKTGEPRISHPPLFACRDCGAISYSPNPNHACEELGLKVNRKEENVVLSASLTR